MDVEQRLVAICCCKTIWCVHGQYLDLSTIQSAPRTAMARKDQNHPTVVAQHQKLANERTKYSNSFKLFPFLV